LDKTRTDGLIIVDFIDHISKKFGDRDSPDLFTFPGKGNGIGNNDLLDLGFLNSFIGLAGQDRVSGANPD
jgi:hypothetical protein